MTSSAHLHLRDTPSKQVNLQPGQPLTIGRASNNRLALVSVEGVSANHAVVRVNATHGWVVCDWKSSDGTYLEGERIRRCRPLSDGDEIRLGSKGPVLVFSLPAPQQAAPPSEAAPAQQPTAASNGPTHNNFRAAAAPSQPKALRSIDIDGTTVALHEIRSAVVLDEAQYPHIFSWWLLTCVAALLVLPFPILFWPLEAVALVGWILLGSRKNHTLLVVQHDGQALRRQFANRVTALAHRNGIRKAIGQSQQQP